MIRWQAADSGSVLLMKEMTKTNEKGVEKGTLFLVRSVFPGKEHYD